MGKGLFNSKVVLNESVKQQMSKWESANVMLSNPPLLCTLYEVNREATSTYMGTLNVSEYVGENSPIRYNKIINYRVISDSELFGPDTKEDFGFQIDTQLNVLLLPGLANPEDNSIIVFNHLPNLYFRLTNSNLSRVMPNTYSQSQLAVHFVGSDPRSQWLEKQVVATYEVEKYNDGAFTISSDVIKKRDHLCEVLDEALETYISTYYDKALGSIAIKTNKDILYDPYLQRFLQKNRVLSDMSMTNFLLTSEEVMLEDKFDLLYKRSFFGRIEKKRALTVASLEYYKYTFMEKSHSWSRLYEFYNTHDIRIITKDEGATKYIIDFSRDETIDNSHTIDSLDDIINMYLNIEDLDKIGTEHFEYLIDMDPEDNYDDMIKYAICIYIMKEKIKSLQGTTKDSNIIQSPK